MPVFNVIYAKENVIAYKNRNKPANQLPFLDKSAFSPLMLIITRRVIAPDNNRMTVKPDASMVSSPNANRHSTEFAAKAISASPVKITVFRGYLIDLLISLVIYS